MRSSKASRASSLDKAQAALARGDWEEARTIFDRVRRDSPSAEAWEGLAIATSYLDEGDVSIAAREEAFRCYRAAGNAQLTGEFARAQQLLAHPADGRSANPANTSLMSGNSVLIEHDVLRV